MDDLDSMITKHRGRDGRIRHLRSPKSARSSPPHKIAHLRHHRRQVESIGVVDRGGDQATVMQCNSQAEMDLSSRMKALIESAVDLGDDSRRSGNRPQDQGGPAARRCLIGSGP